MREQYADLWLGFDTEQLEQHVAEAGLTVETVGRLPGATPELPVLMLTAVKGR